jgi:hypothetical protein
VGRSIVLSCFEEFQPFLRAQLEPKSPCCSAKNLATLSLERRADQRS